MNLQAVLQWLGILQQVEARGEAAWVQIKGVLAANGIEADTAQLDAVIADAQRRQVIAAREAAGVTDVSGTVVTGSTGE